LLFVFGFQRLRVTNEIGSAPLPAASILLGILNILYSLALRSEAPLMARTEPQTRRS